MNFVPRIFSGIFSNSKKYEPNDFSEYVGNGTILIGGPGRLFVYLDSNDASLTPCLLRDRTWEPAVDSWLARQLQPGHCFIDIGGNIGIHALTAGQRVGNQGLVIAFEPQAKLLDLFKRSISANIMMGHVHARRMAIGAHEGQVQLGKFEHLTGSATLTPNSMIIDHEIVQMMPLPAALSQISSEIGRSFKPDTIKIDVEGYEMDVWDGMKAWTQEFSDLAIILEFSPVSYRDMGRDPLSFLEDICAHGFEIAVLRPDGHARPLRKEEWPSMNTQQYDLVLTKGERQG